MQISYVFTDEDKKRFVSCNFQNQDNKYKILSYLAVFIPILIAIIALIAQDYTSSFIFFILFLSMYTCFFVSPKKARKKHLKNIESSGVLKEEKTVSLEKENIVIHSTSRTISHKYSNIKKVSIIDNYFVLILFKDGDSFTIPNSTFSSIEHRIDFVNIIKTNARIL